MQILLDPNRAALLMQLADDQKVMLAHIQDLQRKIDGATFNLQQLQYGRQAFVNALKEALEKEEE